MRRSAGSLRLQCDRARSLRQSGRRTLPCATRARRPSGACRPDARRTVRRRRSPEERAAPARARTRADAPRRAPPRMRPPGQFRARQTRRRTGRRAADRSVGTESARARREHARRPAHPLHARRSRGAWLVAGGRRPRERAAQNGRTHRACSRSRRICARAEVEWTRAPAARGRAHGADRAAARPSLMREKRFMPSRAIQYANPSSPISSAPAARARGAAHVFAVGHGAGARDHADAVTAGRRARRAADHVVAAAIPRCVEEQQKAWRPWRAVVALSSP